MLEKKEAGHPAGVFTEDGLKAIFKSSVIYSASDIALKMIGFFLVPLYTRAMPPSDYGILGFTNALTQVLSPLAGLGLVGSLPILYYSFHGIERKRLISSIVNFTLIFSLMVSVFLTLAGKPLFGIISRAIPFEPYIVLTVWGIFSMVFFYLPLGIFNMKEKAASYALYAIGIAVINVAANIVFVSVLRLGAAGALLAGLVGGGVSMLLAFAVIQDDYLPVLDWKMTWIALSLAVPALPHLFSANLWRFADRFFLADISGLATTGIYSLAMTVSTLILMVFSGFATALNPFFFKRANASDPQLPFHWSRMFSLFFFIAAMSALLLIAAGPVLISFIAPREYHSAGFLLPVMAIGQVFTGMYWFMAPAIGFKRKTWVYPLASFPAVLVNILLNALLIPRFGSFGAAWAMAAAAVLQFSIFAFFSQRFYRVPYSVRQIVSIVLFTAVVLSVLFIMPHFPNRLLEMTIRVTAVALLPVGLYANGFFSEPERAVAQMLLAVFKKR